MTCTKLVALALVLCLAARGHAHRFHNSYFNSTAHALRVYGHSYYNPMTGVALEGHVEEDSRFSLVNPKISFRGLPCACVESSCGCCVGLNITAIKFDRRYCTNFTYDSTTLTIYMKVLMNENEIYKTSVSARNPPPVCVPLPYVPVLDFCLRFYDLKLQQGNNLHTCIDFETRVAQSPLLVMHFNCVRVGAQGIAWVKPGDSEANAVASLPPLGGGLITSTPQQATDVYDEVEFETGVMSDGFPIAASTTLSPEDEDKIGEHRIVKPKPSTQGIEDTQVTEDTQGVEDAQGTQDTQGIEDTQDSEDSVGTKDTQSSEDGQGSTQETQGSEDNQGIQDTQDTQVTRDSPDIQDAQNIQDTQNTQDTQDTLNIQDTPDIHITQE